MTKTILTIDDSASIRQMVAMTLTGAGLDWYEVSNWARPGHECRHNQLYWSQGDYLALGCAAHGHRHDEYQPEQVAQVEFWGCHPLS